MNICVLCPDTNVPYGGIKQLYRHVDVLNNNGFSASILHSQYGFRCTWFNNNTKVAYASGINRELIDYLLLPVIHGPYIAEIGRGIKKVISNQGCYCTFNGYSIDKNNFTSPYSDPEVVATLVVSDDSRQYLQYVFPKLKIFKIHNGIDPSLFSYKAEKKRQIAFMVSKCAQDVIQLINILKFRGVLKDYDLVPIVNKSETEVANIMQESLIFLSFGYQEGFLLPPAEAMACGCIVIGYHGNGGKEFFKPEFSYPIPQADIIAFAKAVEEVMDIYKNNPELLREKGLKAANFIRENYSLEREAGDIIGFWRNINNL